jgi:Fe-S cluster biogenesis protein NfuA/nitrite reductase/ring-hydroxylating ferredoxin subunit
MPEPQNLRAVGDRIDHLLEELQSSTDERVWQRVEEALRLITELYGAALARVVELADPGLLGQLTGDDLVASLLLVHGLHPDDVTDRVRQALERVRPYLGSHGGDVELLGVDHDRVSLRMLGSCHGCPSSAVTLKLAVEQAILEAAPEIEAIDVEDASGDEPPAPPEIIGTPIQLGRKPPAEAGDWAPVYGLSQLPSGALMPVAIGDERILVCRLGETLYAYRNSCPLCGTDLDEAPLEGEVLRCQSCRAAFHVRLAGKNLDGNAAHLDPIPLLQHNGGVRIAVAAGALS